MQTSSSPIHSQATTGSDNPSPAAQPPPVARLPLEGICHGSDVHIQLEVPHRENGERRVPRRQRASFPGTSHGHTHASSSEESVDAEDTEHGEHGSAMSELRCVFQWLQKSLPYILILCSKLIVQHILGISIGIGLLTTFLYANKSIVNQVFLRKGHLRYSDIYGFHFVSWHAFERTPFSINLLLLTRCFYMFVINAMPDDIRMRSMLFFTIGTKKVTMIMWSRVVRPCLYHWSQPLVTCILLHLNHIQLYSTLLTEKSSKLQCLWILVFLTSSSILLYYSFLAESLYYSLIFMSPAVGFLHFWDVLWIVGVTDCVLKFIFMGLKCLVLLVPSFVMSFKFKGYCYMFLEEFGQCYRMLIPTPVWFRYLIGSRELHSVIGWILGILLALFYLILKLLEVFVQWKTFKKILKIFHRQPQYGVTANKRQCSDAGEICPICQVEFNQPIALACQHIFCEECIALWFNREKTCPLCRTVISDHVYKWKDGATSPHLQVY